MDSLFGRRWTRYLLGLGAAVVLAGAGVSADGGLGLVMGGRTYPGESTVINGHLWVPLYELGEFLHLPVVWDGTKRTVALGTEGVLPGGSSAKIPPGVMSGGANLSVQIWGQSTQGVYTPVGTPGGQWADLTLSLTIRNNGPNDILLNFSRSLELVGSDGRAYGVDYPAEVQAGSQLTGWQVLQPGQMVQGNLVFLVPHSELGKLALALVGSGGEPLAEWAINPE